MPQELIYYSEASFICFVIFGILLLHDRVNMDRQEKQIKYNHALIAFMCYFVSDCFWLAVELNVIPKNMTSVSIVNFLNYVIMAAITYLWLRYVMAVEQVPNRERPTNKIAVIFPFLISTAALTVMFIIDPGLLFESGTKSPTMIYNAIFLVVPSIYIIAVLIYSIRKARVEPNPIERKLDIYIGFFPLMVVACGLVQIIFLPNLPVFCFSCTFLMLIFFIKSMDAQISTDPLTGLNNRGKLVRYITQEASSVKEGKRVFVLMIDIDNFKSINDNYGHSEGDRALIMIADSLKNTVESLTTSAFLGRYGGDEFIIIAEFVIEEQVIQLVKAIRENIEKGIMAEKLDYSVSVSIGYDEFVGKGDSVQNCIQRADKKLYKDKKQIKARGAKE